MEVLKCDDVNDADNAMVRTLPYYLHHTLCYYVICTCFCRFLHRLNPFLSSLPTLLVSPPLLHRSRARAPSRRFSLPQSLLSPVAPPRPIHADNPNPFNAPKATLMTMFRRPSAHNSAAPTPGSVPSLASLSLDAFSPGALASPAGAADTGAAHGADADDAHSPMTDSGLVVPVTSLSFAGIVDAATQQIGRAHVLTPVTQ